MSIPEVIANRFRNSATILKLLPDKVPWLPFEWSVAITTACNLKCKMCVRTVYNMKSVYMSKEVFTRILDYTQGKTITIMGAGEPFMHPQVFDFIELCQARNTICNLVTNGVLLTETKIRQLLEYPTIKSITFSIDGVYYSYNEARTNSNFEKVFNNLRLTSLLRKNKAHPSLAVNFLGSKLNTADFPILTAIVSPYIETITLLQLLIFEQDKVDYHLNRNYELASKAITKSKKVAYRHNVELILRPLVPTAKGCLSPWFSTYIDTFGEVHPCCMLGGNEPIKSVEQYYRDAQITCATGEYTFGNIMETDFREIWNSEKLKHMRKQLKQVHSADLKRNHSEQEFVDMLKAWTPDTFFCKVCMLRWGCAC